MLISIFNSVMCDEQFLAWMTVQIGYYAPMVTGAIPVIVVLINLDRIRFVFGGGPFG